MKRYMPEFVAVPLVVALLGLTFVILWAADAGVGAWLAVGAVLLVLMVVAAVVAMRRPRGSAAIEDSTAFEGGAVRVDDGVHRVLLVVDATCTTSDLEQLAGEHAPRTSVFVVAPAVSSRLARWTGDEQAYASADEHLEAAVDALSELGCEARGHVGAHDPLQAADDGLREFPADEILFVLAGEHGTTWLEDGVVDLARDRYALPVRRLAPANSAGARGADA